MHFITILTAVVCAFIMSISTDSTDSTAMAGDIDPVRIGVFFEWPSPNLVGIAEKTFETEMGVEIAWKAYETSYDMNRAFTNGELDIAYGHELVPFMDAVSRGIDIVATGIAISYQELDACVVGEHAGINRQNIKQLEGRKVFVQTGGTTHYRLTRMLDYLEVDILKMEVIAIGDGAAAAKSIHSRRGALACAYGGSVRRMQEKGQLLMTGDEMEGIGLKFFDLVSMSRAFVEEKGQLGKQFLEITNRYNSAFERDPGIMKKKIARASNLSLMTTNRFMKPFSFPDNIQQASVEWLGDGGVVERYMSDLAAFLGKSGKLEMPMSDYSGFIDTRFLQ
jgi:taurine transport system substrate-binding protein